MKLQRQRVYRPQIIISKRLNSKGTKSVKNAKERERKMGINLLRFAILAKETASNKILYSKRRWNVKHAKGSEP